MAGVPAVPVVPWLSISCLPWEVVGSRVLGLRVPPDLCSCTSLAVVALVWATCPLCQLSMSLAGTTSAGCLHLLLLSALSPEQLVATLAGRLAGHSPTCHPRSRHVSLALPRPCTAGLTCILGSSGRNGCEHSWLETLSRGSGTLFGVRGHSRPQVPPGGVLGCPHSTALPGPPGPRQHHHLSLFFF